MLCTSSADQSVLKLIQLSLTPLLISHFTLESASPANSANTPNAQQKYLPKFYNAISSHESQLWNLSKRCYSLQPSALGSQCLKRQASSTSSLRVTHHRCNRTTNREGSHGILIMRSDNCLHTNTQTYQPASVRQLQACTIAGTHQEVGCTRALLVSCAVPLTR